MVNRISMIVTTYNCREYVDELAQGLRAYSPYLHELIVVDDCSSDGSFEMLERLLVSCVCPMQFLRTTENSGRPARPRNTGIQAAVGDHLLFMDADDLLPVDYVGYLADSELDTRCIYNLNRRKVIRPRLLIYGKIPRFRKIPSWFQRYKNVVCFSGSIVERRFARKHEFAESYLEDWLYFRSLVSTYDLKILKSSNMSLQYRHAEASITPRKLTQVERVKGFQSLSAMSLYFLITLALMVYEIVFVTLEPKSQDLSV